MGTSTRQSRRAAARSSRTAAARLAPAAAAPASPPVRRLTAAIIGVVVLSIYIRTLCPTVAGGDSGELIAAASTLGVVHPPGYPLYTLLAKLFTLLPLGTIAWRVNLFSAVCGAGAATMLCLAVTRWSGRVWAGVSAASLFAFSPVVWTNAVTAEVFALNNFFAALLLYLSVRFWEDRDLRIASLLFFCIGLGLSNHHTLLFFAVPVALFVLITGGRAVWRPARLGWFSLCAAAGFLPYLYLPIASARASMTSWGDQTTVSGFLTHFLRREYGTFQLGIDEKGPGGQLFERLHLYASNAFGDLLWIGPVLALIGAVFALRSSSRRLAWCWIAAFVFFVLVINTLANGSLEPGVARFVESRFWQQPHLLICAFAGLGLASLAGRLGATAPTILPVAALAIAIAQPAVHFRQQDKSHDTHVRDFVKAILDSLPQRALLLEHGDHVFNGVRYLQVVEAYRPDVVALDQLLLSYSWYESQVRRGLPEVVLPGSRLFPRRERAGDFGMNALLDANRDRFQIYFCDVQLWEDARDAYTVWPSGLVDRVLPKSDDPQLIPWIASSRSSLARLDPAALQRYPVDSWEHTILTYYWKQTGKNALSFARWGQQHGADRAALERSAALMETLLAGSPDAPPSLHRDLGIVYQQLSTYDPSLLPRMRRELETYLKFAPPTDPEVPAIRRLIGQ